MAFNPNDTSYERRKIITYLIDSGVEPDTAAKRVAKWTDRKVRKVIDYIPQEGHE